MNTQSLLDRYFEVAFSAPEGVKRLRELILNLAMRGLLVPQDPTAQPARELLREIDAEKEQLIRAGKLKRSNKLPETLLEEIPYELPESWQWVTLITLGFWAIGSGFPKNLQGKSQGNILLCKVSDMNLQGNEKYIQVTNSYITEEMAKIAKIKVHEPGTVIFPKIGGSIATNKRRILLKKTAIDNNCLGIKFCNPVNLDWAFLVLKSMDFQKYQSGTSIPAINQSTIGSILIALPPLEEQKRIVEKVDRLMEQCDRLEQLHKEREQKRIIVHAAARDRLLNAKGDRELQTAWEFLRDRFGDLYAVKENISELRKAILQLAVMGKLVPQDPNDPTASELLKEIEAEKKRLIKNKELKIGQVTQDSKSINTEKSLPLSWIWVKGFDLFFITKLAGFEYTKYIQLKDFGEIPVVRAQNIKPFNLNLNNLKYIDLAISNLLERCALTKKALLVTFIGAGIGDVALFDLEERWHLAPNVAKIEPFKNCENFLDMNYFLYFLNSPVGRDEIFKHLKSTAQPSISMGTIRDIDYPLPPLPEQCRIVAKVDQLMQLCDQLESKIDQQTQTQTRLLNALIDQLNNT